MGFPSRNGAIALNLAVHSSTYTLPATGQETRSSTAQLNNGIYLQIVATAERRSMRRQDTLTAESPATAWLRLAAQGSPPYLGFTRVALTSTAWPVQGKSGGVSLDRSRRAPANGPIRDSLRGLTAN